MWHAADTSAFGKQVMVDCLSKLQGTVVGVVGMGHLDGMERLWAERQNGETK